MRKVFDSLSHLSLKKFISKDNLSLAYIPYNNSIHIFSFDNIENNFNKVADFNYDDEILDFHILEEDAILLIGKNNKKITILNKTGEKLSE
jgi:hypothetical protein